MCVFMCIHVCAEGIGQPPSVPQELSTLSFEPGPSTGLKLIR